MLLGSEAFVDTMFELETRTGGEERIVLDGDERLSSSLYGLNEDFFSLS